MSRRSQRYFNKPTVNYGLLLPIFLMLILSVWLQYWVATYEDVSAINQGVKQVIFICIGLGGMLVIKFIDKTTIICFSLGLIGLNGETILSLFSNK